MIRPTEAPGCSARAHSLATDTGGVSRLQLRPGLPTEAVALSALALRSKAHWGYDEDFLARCREDLTVLPGDCDGRRLVVAVVDGVLAGYVRIAGTPPDAGELEALFVDPPHIGSGCGRALLARAVEIAAAEGMMRLGITADPFAQPFYERAGALPVGDAPSTVIPGRRLPRLQLVVPWTRPAASRPCA